MSRSNFSDAFRNLRSEFAKKRHEAVESCVVMIEADAKLNSPVLTGNLKRSITHDVQDFEDKTVGVVGSNVEYAYWVERKSPYLEPAVDQNIENMKRKIAEVFGK